MWVEMNVSCINPQFSSSSSSWGCELKYPLCIFPFLPLSSSSSWGCELKCVSVATLATPLLSSSSWGCELKYIVYCCRNKAISHPLREDVSWNLISKSINFRIQVILFVRMWVEILIYLYNLLECPSSSSWGCELKYKCKCWIKVKNTSSSSWGCELK